MGATNERLPRVSLIQFDLHSGNFWENKSSRETQSIIIIVSIRTQFALNFYWSSSRLANFADEAEQGRDYDYQVGS